MATQVDLLLPTTAQSCKSATRSISRALPIQVFLGYTECQAQRGGEVWRAGQGVLGTMGQWVVQVQLGVAGQVSWKG